MIPTGSGADVVRVNVPPVGAPATIRSLHGRGDLAGITIVETGICLGISVDRHRMRDRRQARSPSAIRPCLRDRVEARNRNVLVGGRRGGDLEHDVVDAGLLVSASAAMIACRERARPGIARVIVTTKVKALLELC